MSENNDVVELSPEDKAAQVVEILINLAKLLQIEGLMNENGEFMFSAASPAEIIDFKISIKPNNIIPFVKEETTKKTA